MGALEAPQDKHGQEHRTGTSRAEQTTETMAVQGAQEAMAGGPRGRGLVPLGPAPTAGTLLPSPKKNSLGNSHADLQWAMTGITSGDFLAAGQTQTQEQNKTFKNENKTR